MIEPLIHRILIKQAEIKEALAAGGVLTWEQYHRVVGEHQGLQDVIDMINSMLDEEKEDR